MPLPRLMCLLPALLLAVTMLWSGAVVVTRQQARLPEEWRVMLPGDLPDLNPFQPGDESEKQILDLLHEPLIRLDRQGRPAPGLAEEWRWHLRVSCWFENARDTAKARASIESVPAEKRLEWGLEEVLAQDDSLILRFAKPGTAAADEALRHLAGSKPNTLTFWRVGTWPQARQAMEDLAADETRSRWVKRLWFDDQGACEIVSTLGQADTREALVGWLRARLPRLPEMSALGAVAGLAEPVLEFRLSPARARWHDGAPVSVSDIEATVKAALGEAGAPHEGLRHIQSIEPAGEHALRVAYRRSLGSVLGSWIGLPILRQGDHGKPGAGPWRVAERDVRSILLVRQEADGDGRQPGRLRFFPAQPARAMPATLAARGLDVAWPDEAGFAAMQPWMEKRAQPSSGQLLLLWNAQSPTLADPRLRAALGQALDRAALAEGAGARVLDSLTPPGLWFSPPEPQARPDGGGGEALRALGWLKDISGIVKKDGKPLEFTLLVASDNEPRIALARAMAAQWLQAGVRAAVETVPADGLIEERLAKGRFDAVILGRGQGTGWDATAWWHSAGALHFSGLADPRLDLLLEALAEEFDLTRIPLRAEAVELRLRELHSALPLLADAPFAAVSKSRYAGVPGATLRDLLNPAPPEPVNLQMLEPKE